MEIHRSLRFVSLDTHPALNALVVTYEIVISVEEVASGKELTRRSKRDQMQINISLFDKVIEGDNEDEWCTDKLVGKFRDLTEEILRKCPLLLAHSSNETQIYEDIQLHLLYLINRKQQLAAKNAIRPPSSLGPSATMAATKRQLSARGLSRPTSAASSGGRGDDLLARETGDVYDNFIKNQESGELNRGHDDEEFIGRLSAHLSNLEPLNELEQRLIKGEPDEDLIESHLESLYGDSDERRLSMAVIRRLCQEDMNLPALSANKLLTCALLRLLRDPQVKDQHLSESILYCLIRFTRFEDIHDNSFGTARETQDLTRAILDSLDEHMRVLARNSDDFYFFQEKLYQSNCLILILTSLIKFDDNRSQAIKSQLLTDKEKCKKLIEALSGLLHQCNKHLAQSIQADQSQDRLMVKLVSRLISLNFHLSVYKEYVNFIRVFGLKVSTNSLINILNTLQLSRPTSGGSTSTNQQSRRRDADQSLMNQIYQLEMELLKLLNNLILDPRLKFRLVKKNQLLKCVLRNLVVFLASRKTSNSLSPFNKSAVLLTPFKCLYELSICNGVKEKLYMSRIIMKCLFEYLLSSAADLKQWLNTSPPAPLSQLQPHSSKSQEDEDQIVLEPREANQYIVAIWLNLSSRKSAPFYGNGAELNELLSEYMDLNLANLCQFIKWSTSPKNCNERPNCPSQEARILIYLHSKLLRNFTQFLTFDREQLSWLPSYLRWIDRLGEYTSQLLEQRKRCPMFNLISVECLASLSNLIDKSNAFEQLSMLPNGGENGGWPKATKSLLDQLFLVDFKGLNNFNQPDLDNGDDLLLIAINFLGSLARNCEICLEIESIFVKIIEACNFIFDSKSTDSEMMISCLFTLSQLMNHSAFLCGIMRSGNPASREHDDQAAVRMLEKLTDRLTGLMLHGDVAVTKLVSSLLNSIKQLEEQQSLADSVSNKKRFIGYNSKWLQAIRANRDDPSGGATPTTYNSNIMIDGCRRRRAQTLDTNSRPGEDLLIKVNSDYDEDDEFSLAANEVKTFQDNTVGVTGARFGPPKAAGLMKDLDEDEDGDNYGGGDDDEEAETEGSRDCCEHECSHEQDTADDESYGEPDLNVIDSNSMIKHLTSRREIRSEAVKREEAN